MPFSHRLATVHRPTLFVYLCNTYSIVGLDLIIKPDFKSRNVLTVTLSQVIVFFALVMFVHRTHVVVHTVDMGEVALTDEHP